MKGRILHILMGSILLMAVFQSCEDDEYENETKISYYNSTESHNTGENCMSCHKQGGSGEGWFTVAGTVYKSDKTSVYPNATVKLFTSPNGVGDLEATIEVDQYGNFYTTESIDFQNELYAAVEGSSVEYMDMPIITGACSSCHGASTDRIWTE